MKRIFLISTMCLYAGCVSSYREWEFQKRLTIPQGQNRYPIDLETTLRLAASNNLDIALARESVHSAYAKAITAQERFLPTVGPVYRFWRSEGVTQATDGSFVQGVDKQNMLVAGGASLSWPLGDAIFNTLSSLKSHQAAQASLEATSLNTILNSSIAYFELVQEDQRVNILERVVKTSEKVVRETQTAVKLGAGSRDDLLRTQAQRMHNQLALEQAREALKQSSAHLVSLLQLDPRIELSPADGTAFPLQIVSEENLGKLLEEAYERYPAILAAKKQLQAAEYEQSAAKWGVFFPQILSDATSGKFGGVLDNLFSQRVSQFTLGWKIGPGGIFDFGRQEAAQANFNSAKIQLQQVVQQTTDEVVSALIKVQSQSEQMSIAEQGVKDAEESLELKQKRQSAGFGLPMEVIQAEEALMRTQLDYLLAVTEYNKAEFQLVSKLGKRP